MKRKASGQKKNEYKGKEQNKREKTLDEDEEVLFSILKMELGKNYKDVTANTFYPRPFNVVSGFAYSGQNKWLLTVASRNIINSRLLEARNNSNSSNSNLTNDVPFFIPGFITFNQAKANVVSINRGAKMATRITVYQTGNKGANGGEIDGEPQYRELVNDTNAHTWTGGTKKPIFWIGDCTIDDKKTKNVITANLNKAKAYITQKMCSLGANNFKGTKEGDTNTGSIDPLTLLCVKSLIKGRINGKFDQKTATHIQTTINLVMADKPSESLKRGIMWPLSKYSPGEDFIEKCSKKMPITMKEVKAIVSDCSSYNSGFTYYTHMIMAIVIKIFLFKPVNACTFHNSDELMEDEEEKMLTQIRKIVFEKLFPCAECQKIFSSSSSSSKNDSNSSNRSTNDENDIDMSDDSIFAPIKIDPNQSDQFTNEDERTPEQDPQENNGNPQMLDLVEWNRRSDELYTECHQISFGRESLVKKTKACTHSVLLMILLIAMEISHTIDIMNMDLYSLQSVFIQIVHGSAHNKHGDMIDISSQLRKPINNWTPSIIQLMEKLPNDDNINNNNDLEGVILENDSTSNTTTSKGKLEETISFSKEINNEMIKKFYSSVKAAVSIILK